MKTFYTLLLAILMTHASACSDNKEDPAGPGGKNALELETNSITLDYWEQQSFVSILSGIEENMECESNQDWCAGVISGDQIVVAVSRHTGASERSATLTLTSGNNKSQLLVKQTVRNLNTGDIPNDIQLKIAGGEMSNFQPGEGIEKSYDGSLSTWAHSLWNNVGVTNYFPITFTYYLEEASSMDYLIYYPRNDGGKNGNFKEFELWIATKEKPELVKYGEYNFNGASSAGRVNFTSAIINPTTVRFVVKSGSGDDQGFASCAEMEFYRYNPENFDYLTIFEDKACTRLKSGINEEYIRKIENEFFRTLAMEIFKGEYEEEFRIQEYSPWQHPDIMAELNKTSPYSLRDNPTGIAVKSSEELIVFADDLYGQSVSLLVQDLTQGYGGNSYALAEGMNKFTMSGKGLIYVIYHTDNATEKPVKLNIATGTVNGYFDSNKHTQEDWERLLANASWQEFDLVGKYAHATFPVQSFHTYTPDGLALINKLDELVYLEQEFMGLVKYDKMFKNRMYFMVDYSDTYMYATSYRTGYQLGTMDLLCSVNALQKEPWGPAHEVGHCNQTRPGLKWQGMTEVTNNIHSLYIQTTFGNDSRLWVEDMSPYKNRYEKALDVIVSAQKAHNDCDDVFCQLVPFWQLKLYLHDVLGKEDFYKDLYEYYRINKDADSSVLTEGVHQLNFVKVVCEIANLDLTDFFEAWGFLTPINKQIDDYGSSRFTITQEQIDKVKKEIASQEYPKPLHTDIYLIHDKNINDYK